MRALLVAVAVVFSACNPPLEPSPEAPTNGPMTQTWSARGEFNPSIYVFSEIGNGGIAGGPLRMEFTLDEPFPQVLDVKPRAPAYVSRCDNSTTWGTERFTTVTEVNGDAAILSVVDGQLHVELHHEGLMSARVEGVVTGAECDFGGETLSTIPTWHLVELKVSRFSGFEVTHREQRSTCGPKVIVAAGSSTSLPTVQALDAEGARFTPMNAPRPVSLTLRGDGDVFVNRDAIESVRLSPGRTRIELGTTLPVRGLESLTAVTSSAVTSADIELGLLISYIKGTQWRALSDGSIFQVPYPDDANDVAVRANRIETTEGTLCSQPASEWFFATSQTPSTCAPVISAGDGAQSVATLLAPGECRATVGLRGTSLQWSTRFTASF
ncbi:MAG: hypothetical protein ACO1OB_20915 [Archangium sp.]